MAKIFQLYPPYDCVSCTETKSYDHVYIASCGHVYCTTCLIKMFEDSLKDESVYPPRCCQQNLPLGCVSKVLGLHFTREFKTREIEVATLNRTYCHVATCSTFILPCDISANGSGLCGTCYERTCTRCKQAAHEGHCAEPSRPAVFALAEAQGWQSCSRCHAIVELRNGCNHIT